MEEGHYLKNVRLLQIEDRDSDAKQIKKKKKMEYQRSYESHTKQMF